MIEENCVPSQGAILQTSTQPKFQKSITQKIDQLGIKYSFEEQKRVLEDWMEITIFQEVYSIWLFEILKS